MQPFGRLSFLRMLRSRSSAGTNGVSSCNHPLCIPNVKIFLKGASSAKPHYSSSVAWPTRENLR